MKKFPVKIKNVDAKRDKGKGNILKLVVVLDILNFGELVNALKKVAVKKAPRKYKDIVQCGIEVFNAEVQEVKKADFVYRVIESAEFKMVLRNTQEEILNLIKVLARDFAKLDITLQSVDLDIMENIRN